MNRFQCTVALLVVVACGALVVVEPSAAMTQNAEPLASAEQIIQRGLDAMGGAEAIERIASAHYKMISENMEMEFLSSGSTRAIMRKHQAPTDGLPGMTVDHGDNGTIGWSERCAGNTYTLTVGPVGGLDKMRHLTFLHRIVLDLRTRPVRIESAGQVRWDESDCFKIIAHYGDGIQDSFYFDAQSGLLKAIEQPTVTDRPGAVIRFGEWKYFGGIKLSSIIAITYDTGQRPVFAVSSAQFNTLNPAIFDDPPGADRIIASQTALVLTLTDEQVNGMTAAQLKTAIDMLGKRQLTEHDVVTQEKLQKSIDRFMNRLGEIER